MAHAVAHKKVLTVRSLKKFLEGVSENIVIRGNFDERIDVIVWERDHNEGGPKLWLQFEEVI